MLPRQRYERILDAVSVGTFILFLAGAALCAAAIISYALSVGGGVPTILGGVGGGTVGAAAAVYIPTRAYIEHQLHTLSQHNPNQVLLGPPPQVVVQAVQPQASPSHDPVNSFLATHQHHFVHGNQPATPAASADDDMSHARRPPTLE